MSRGRIIIWSLLLAVAALVAVGWFSIREPRAGGESLSYWLCLGVASGEQKSPESEAAIREIGTKAIPTLLAKLQVTDSPWKEQTHQWLNKQNFYSFEFTPDYHERASAIYGFTVLGSNALPALPALERMFWDTNTSWEAAHALAQLGQVSLPILRAGFTNSDPAIRRAAVTGTMNNKLTAAVLPDMRQLRHDSDRIVATAALNQLLRFSSREEATQLAIETLEDNRARMRGAVLNWFNQARIETNRIVPFLIRLLEDPDPRFRFRVTNVLKQLDPVAAAAAGINTNPPPVSTGLPGGRGRGRAPAATNATNSSTSR